MTPEAARRAALAASGFASGRPNSVTRRHLKRVFGNLGLVQIDSVARVVRSHYLPFYSRLGPYPMPLLDSLLHQPERMGVEYWMHEAAYAPPSTIALAHGRRADWWVRDYGQRDPQTGRAFVSLMADLEAELTAGPGTARELAARVSHDIPERPRDHWGWNPSRVKAGLEALFRAGRISVAARSPAFERVFALPADVHSGLPVPELRFGPPHDPELGLRPHAPRRIRGSSGVSDDIPALVRIAAAALGVATASCLADYFRMPVKPVREAAAELARTGELIEVDVAGVHAFRWHAAVVPRRIDACALLAPFDPLVFNRRRISWLFDFDYRIEIYTPAHARVHGYYVLPFLLGEELVGRVDLAADRGRDALVAHGVHWEPGHRHEPELMQELHRMREWLGLSSLVISG
ncbi:winged helix-turn-helix domain-containing protein [Brevibacterium daeguense]|uniref:Winged helix-turn-helix domain-containing protein n=2 Tax=Brevibacterium daeguense TaxID=909936 RepID=A0ABP8EMC9_9MICO|nr:crosslink repair DNA glycosylase YcaQ family protein [Brevibacterium daeguense]